MLREASLEIEATPTWALEPQLASPSDWQSIDQALRTIAQRRAALDADEARWLREAEACQIWRPLGMVSAIDYMERVLGYAPRSAQERLRVARALGTLPQLTAALAQGELPFSAVRELTRVATLATEAAWVAAATGKNLRQIEELVADHRPGDAKAGNTAPVPRSPAALPRSSARRATRNTSDRSTTIRRRAPTRTFRRASRDWCGVAMEVAAACPDVGPRAAWSCITWSIASTAVAMTQQTSCWSRQPTS